MLTIIAAIAGSLSGPEIIPDAGFYPSDALRGSKSAAALIEFVIDPKGRPVNCHTLKEFGDASLSRRICELQRSAEFKPALNETGEPSYGIVRAFIRYIAVKTEQGKQIVRLVAPEITHEVVGTRVRSGSRFPDYNQFRIEAGPPQIIAYPDVIYEVKSMPGIDSDTLLVRVSVAIDSTGTVSNCVTNAPADSDSTKSKYAVVACRQLQGTKVADPLIVNEQSVPFVRSLEVQFAISAEK